MALEVGSMRDRVRFERPVRPVGIMKSGQATWQEVVTVYAEVQDVLPSRAERVAEGVNIARRPCRVRIRYRRDIAFDSSMRIVFGDRVMEIISGPAVLGNRERFEFVAEDLSTAAPTQ